MKKIAVLSFLLLAAAGCSKSPLQAVNSPAQGSNNSNSLTVSSRSQDNLTIPQNQTATPPIASTAPKTGAKTKWTQSGDPVETKDFDAAIVKAEKEFKTKPSDEAAKKALAESYFKRGVALTEARQYAAALGDYRKSLKYDPSNQEAQTWINRIVEIYDGLNKDYPKDGEEPPPLPFNKKT